MTSRAAFWGREGAISRVRLLDDIETHIGKAR
jgi:hypothetical protein